MARGVYSVICNMFAEFSTASFIAVGEYVKVSKKTVKVRDRS